MVITKGDETEKVTAAKTTDVRTTDTRTTTVKDTTMVTTALKMALWRRDHADRGVGAGLIHHSDAGSQYTSIAFAETLVLERIAASIGSIGDAYDKGLAS